MIKFVDLPPAVQEAIRPHMKSDDPDELPPDVEAAIAPHRTPDLTLLEAVSATIAAKRDDAKNARASSGIETVWQDAEEAYVGVDDANRGEYQGVKWNKPVSSDGPVTTGRATASASSKSTAYVRLTARYVDAGAAKLAEILLPVDDKAFSFSETPVPELIRAKDDNSPIVHDGMGNVPLTRNAKPEEIPALAPGTPSQGAAPAAAPGGQPGAAGGAPQVPLRVKDIADEQIELANKKAKRAEKRIYDWQIECQYQSESRKIIFDAARIGVGVIKAPFPKVVRAMAVTKQEDGSLKLQVNDTIKPAGKWINPWNFYPDPSCGENIHNGDYTFECDNLSDRQVRDLKDLPGYIAKQIDTVLEEGPSTNQASRASGGREDQKDRQKDRYQVWYYYGTLKPEEMNCICQAAGQKDLGDDPPKLVYAIVTMINSHVVKAAFNPLDSGAFPYDTMPWQRRSDHWAGIGVAEQVKMPQRMVNAATRAMLDNAGISAGGQIILDLSSIKPADGKWSITPNKLWLKTADSGGDDVRKAFHIIEMPNVTVELMTIIEYALKLGEESTSIPLITQGQTGETTPETLGATQLQNTNANQLLRSIGYSYDDHITDPVTRRFYEWLLLDPDVPDDEKGDFTINAHGSVALVERAIQDQTIAQMATIVVNPIYGGDPKKWFKEYLKSKRIDPQSIQYTPEEQAKIDAMPPPKAPQIEAAEINRDARLKVGVMQQTTDQQSLQNERSIADAARVLEGSRVAAEQERTHTDATVELHRLHTLKEIEMLKHATARGKTLDEIKGELAKTMMTLEAQERLNTQNNAVDIHKHHNPAPKPPVQAPGRAGNGHSFDQGRAG